MLINSNNSIQPPYGTVESARRKCSLRYSYVALVSGLGLGLGRRSHTADFEDCTP